jgi:uncharacterized Zn-binding protein involved in type VI secretion
MPPASRLTDIAVGHGSFIPSDVIQASPNVITCGLAQHRKTDAIRAHPSPSPSPPHARHAACGSSTVFVNDLNLVRIGDCVDCGGFLIQGCGTVIVGG